MTDDSESDAVGSKQDKSQAPTAVEQPDPGISDGDDSAESEGQTADQATTAIKKPDLKVSDGDGSTEFEGQPAIADSIKVAVRREMGLREKVYLNELMRDIDIMVEFSRQNGVAMPDELTQSLNKLLFQEDVIKLEGVNK